MEVSTPTRWRRWLTRWIASVITVCLIYIPLMVCFHFLGWNDEGLTLRGFVLGILPLVFMVYLIEEAKDFYARRKAQKSGPKGSRQSR